jgi:hypothetical protein
MRYGLAFRYVISQPGGFVQVLLMSLCQFIPAVGPIVLKGYLAILSEVLSCDPDLSRHPKFDFNRFVEYLTRGVWPFLMQLVFTVPMAALMMVLWVVMVFGAMAQGPRAMPLAFLGFMAIYFVCLIAYMAVVIPMLFHAELSNKFDLPGAFRFMRDFWRLVGGKALVTALVFFPLSILVMIVGLLCCFVGIYVAATLVQLAAQHLMVQLYVEYLDRGGEPLFEKLPLADLRVDVERYDEYEDDEDYR